MKAQSVVNLAILLTLTALTLASCGAPIKSGTNVNPATVSLSKEYRDQSEASERTTEVTITPTTQPTTQAASVTIPYSGGTLQAPAGAAVTFKTVEKGIPANSHYTETADAVGPSLRTDGDKGDFKGSAPEVALGATDFTGPNGGAKAGKSSGQGGKVATDWIAKAISSLPGTTWGAKLGWGAGIFLVVGAIIWAGIQRFMHVAIDWPLFGILAGGGFAIIMFSVVAETYPWVLLILSLLIVAGIVWYEWFWKTKQNGPTTLPQPAPVDPKP